MIEGHGVRRASVRWASVRRARGRRSGWAGATTAIVMTASLTAGCYAQKPLPRQPSYRPASWEPVLGLTTLAGEDVTFDEPATIDRGEVRGRVEGVGYRADLSNVLRLQVGRKTLDKTRTALLAAVAAVAIVFFFRSIGTEIEREGR